MLDPWKTAFLLCCASLPLVASAQDKLDATRVSCAQFVELEPSQQKRILSFLQGYAHREVPDDKVGSVPIGAGLGRVTDACAKAPTALAWTKVQEAAAGPSTGERGEARLTRSPTLITCKSYLKLSRENRRLTVYWLDGYSRTPNPSDANQGVVDLRRNAEDFAEAACSKRKQRLWWAIRGSVRSVDARIAS